MKKLCYAIVLAALVVGCGQKSDSVNPKEIDKDTAKSMINTDVNEKIDSSKDDLESKINSKLSDSNFNKVYFDFDKYDIRKDMYSVISDGAELLNNAKMVNVIVEGNCDEWGSEEYNQALGLKRAKAVKDGLEAQGVDGGRIQIKSYGENNPVCTEKSKSCDALNRRAEIKIKL